MSRAALIAEALVLGAAIGFVVACVGARSDDDLAECRLQLAGYEQASKPAPTVRFASVCPGPYMGCAGVPLVIPRDECPDDSDEECSVASGASR